MAEVYYPPENSLALAQAFQPRRMDPVVAIAAQNFARQAQNQAELAKMREQMALYGELNKQQNQDMLERQLALMDAKALEDERVRIRRENDRRDLTYKRAEKAGKAVGREFKIDPKLTPSQNEAEAEIFIQQANADSYNELADKVKQLHQELTEKQNELYEGPKIDDSRVGAGILRSGMLPESILKHGQWPSLIRQGQIDSVLKDKNLKDKDRSLLQAAIESAYNAEQKRATEEFKLKAGLISQQIREITSRYDLSNEELKQARTGIPAWMLLGRNKTTPTGIGAGRLASMFGVSQADTGIKPRGFAMGSQEDFHGPDTAIAAPMAAPSTGTTSGIALPDLSGVSIPRVPGGGVVPEFANALLGDVEGGARAAGEFLNAIPGPTAVGRTAGEYWRNALSPYIDAASGYVAPAMQALFTGPNESPLPLPASVLQKRAWRVPAALDWMNTTTPVPGESAILPVQ